jgi:hypothetical protein
MDMQELHDFLAGSLGLVPEITENTVSRTYFYRRVEWHPGKSTRVFRVIFESNGAPARIHLCASSDNNNSVLIQAPFHKQLLADCAAKEIALIEAKIKSHGEVLSG